MLLGLWLARNLKDYPFPARLSPAEKAQVNDEVAAVLLEDESLRRIDMESPSDSEAVSLAEKHLISPEFASDAEGRTLLLSQDETVSIMLCEEDHIRI